MLGVDLKSSVWDPVHSWAQLPFELVAARAPECCRVLPLASLGHVPNSWHSPTGGCLSLLVIQRYFLPITMMVSHESWHAAPKFTTQLLWVRTIFISPNNFPPRGVSTRANGLLSIQEVISTWSTCWVFSNSYVQLEEAWYWCTFISLGWLQMVLVLCTFVLCPLFAKSPRSCPSLLVRFGCTNSPCSSNLRRWNHRSQ